MMQENYELRTGEPARVNVRYKGQFTKGTPPPNKGKSWSEWMPLEHQARVKAIAIRNLHGRRKGDAPTNNKSVIAIDSEGRISRHNSIKDASEYFRIGRENVGRCCKCNRRGAEPSKGWKRINTNHRYMGIRFYYEDDVALWSNARRS